MKFIYTYNVPDSVLQEIPSTCSYTWKNQTDYTIAHEGSSDNHLVVDHHLGNITLSERMSGIQYATECLPGQIFRFMVPNSTSTTNSSESFDSPTPTSMPPDSFPIWQVLVPVVPVLLVLLFVAVFIFVKYGRRFFCSPKEREEVHFDQLPIELLNLKVQVTDFGATPLLNNDTPHAANGSTPKVQVTDFGATPLLNNDTPHAANGSIKFAINKDESNDITAHD